MKIECISCAGQGRGNVGKKDEWVCNRCGGSGLEPSRLTRQVTEFHKAVDQPILPKPGVPHHDRIRLRLKLIAEEFFELLDACGVVAILAKDHVMASIDAAGDFRNGENQSMVDLPGVADALADLDYVVEGTRLEFGINGAPIADAVHVANLKNLAAENSGASIFFRPRGRARMIAGELRKQGWEG